MSASRLYSALTGGLAVKQINFPEQYMIIIKLPWKTPSINHLYGQRGYRKYLKPEAKELREKIIEIVNEEKRKGYSISNHLKVVVEIHENWYTKKGLVKRVDVANREKFLIDSVFEALQLDDKFIFEHTMKKVQAEEEFAIIKIETL